MQFHSSVDDMLGCRCVKSYLSYCFTWHEEDDNNQWSEVNEATESSHLTFYIKKQAAMAQKVEIKTEFRCAYINKFYFNLWLHVFGHNLTAAAFEIVHKRVENPQSN